MDWGFTAFVTAIALLVAVGGSLLLVGYFGTLPASFNFGWKAWLPTLLLPVLGPVWFALTHRDEFLRPALQLIFGLLLIAAAVGLLFGFGQHFANQLVAGIK
jgi:hypothetical protein